MTAGDFRITHVMRVGFGVVEVTIEIDLGQLLRKFWIHLQPHGGNEDITVLPADPEGWDFCEFCLVTIKPYLCLIETHKQALEGRFFPYSEHAQEIADALLLFMR